MIEPPNAPDTSIVIPAFNEAASVGAVVGALLAAARWREILVVDDGSSDDTGARAETAGARVVRHPYNKGNGAAVKTGIRHATGAYILIADADGQHQPADATRLVSHLDRYDLVVGARSSHTQASTARRVGNAALNRLRSQKRGARAFSRIPEPVAPPAVDARIAEHQMLPSSAGKSHSISASMTTLKQSSMSSVIIPSSLIST